MNSILKKLDIILKDCYQESEPLIKVFAIFGLLNYPLFYFAFDVSEERSDIELIMRIIACILCLILLVKNYLPKKLADYNYFIWFITLTYCLPFMAMFYFLYYNADSSWNFNIILGLFWLILIVDYKSFFIISSAGFVIGMLAYFLYKGSIYSLEFNNIKAVIINAIWVIIVVILFSRKKELITKTRKLKEIENFNKEILAYADKLDHALAAKTEFLNNMSHEIRTPISGFTTISEILVESWNKFDDAKKFSLVQQIYFNSKRLYSLIGNLLDLSKFNAGKMLLNFEKTDLNILITNMIDECKTLYLKDKKITFKFYPAKDSEIIADSERITQVLRNLFTNAIKYSDDKTAITIKITKTHIVYENKKLKAVKITIADQGVGVPENELEAIFEPFTESSNTKSKAGGTGLGLAISKEIICAHHGKIWAENKEDIGTIFHFIVPISQEDKLTSQETISNNNSLQNITNRNKSATILIIDDEAACLTSLELLLEQNNYKILKAQGGAEGLEYLNSMDAQQPIDLILIDLMMPDIYGLNLINIIKQKKELASIPIILQTGTSDMTEIDKAYKLGIISYIKKPYNKSIVIKEINKALNH